MRRSTSPKAACSAAGAQTVTANPIAPGEIGDRDRDRARAADHDLRPRQHRLDEDVHGALARAHVLGEAHAGALVAGLDALRPAARRAAAPRRAASVPSASASCAALSTAARAQPPPIQPSEIVPSGRITALAPALAAVAATVRTTVASANGSPVGLPRRDRCRECRSRGPWVRSSRDRARAPPGSRDCGRARTGRRRAAPPACRAPAGCSRASRSAD